MQEWRLICEKEGFNGFYNMAIDEALSASFEQGESPPSLRIYQWSRPCLTVGFFQRMDGLIDTNYCRKNGIDVIRRITGGRTVLHFRELTYSIVASRKGIFPDTIAGTYKMIQRGLSRGIAKIGVHVLADDSRSSVEKKRRSSACFASKYPHELSVDGRKITGGALRRFKRSFLQHGSILLYADVETLSQCFRYTSTIEEEWHKKYLKRKMVGLNDLDGIKITYKELADAVISGLKAELGIDIKGGELSLLEKRMAEGLFKNKFKI